MSGIYYRIYTVSGSMMSKQRHVAVGYDGRKIILSGENKFKDLDDAVECLEEIIVGINPSFNDPQFAIGENGYESSRKGRGIVAITNHTTRDIVRLDK